MQGSISKERDASLRSTSELLTDSTSTSYFPLIIGVSKVQYMILVSSSKILPWSFP